MGRYAGEEVVEIRIPERHEGLDTHAAAALEGLLALHRPDRILEEREIVLAERNLGRLDRAQGAGAPLHLRSEHGVGRKPVRTGIAESPRPHRAAEAGRHGVE